MNRVWMLGLSLGLLCCVWAPEGHALSARLRYDALVSSKEPYANANNEKASLAWGASYQLMAYVAMLERTGEEDYLDRATKLIDIVLQQRDDKRGVKDFLGRSGACWQNHHYQPQQQPYCYVVHSGMLTYPMAKWVAWIYANKAVGQRKAYDQKTYKDKADDVLKRIEESVRFHSDQWKLKGSAQGYYIFHAKASFMKFTNQAMPLNQQNALGRTLAVLSRITGTVSYTDQTKRLCHYFKAYTKLSGRGLVWNYWPTAYKSPGEDISHGAINATFAVECYKSGQAFSKSDLVRMGYALFDNAFLSATSWRGFIGGGAINTSYAKQLGRWLPLSEYWPVLYGPIRSYYDLTAAQSTSASGSSLVAFAYLAAYEPRAIHHDFYYVDWSNTTSYKQATAFGANLIALPSDPKEPMLIALKYASYGAVELQQWDGKAYHTVQKLPDTSGQSRSEWFVFDPRHWHAYYKGHALFQFKDAKFVSGKGVKVWKPTPLVGPTITSKPSVQALVGQPYAYNASKKATGKGSQPLRWKAWSPEGLRINPTTGVISWTPSSPGTYQGEITLTNDTGSVSQRWTISAVPPLPSEPSPEPLLEAGTEAGLEAFQEKGSEPMLEAIPEASFEPSAESVPEMDASSGRDESFQESDAELVNDKPLQDAEGTNDSSKTERFEPPQDTTPQGSEEKEPIDTNATQDDSVVDRRAPGAEDGVDASLQDGGAGQTPPAQGCGCATQGQPSWWFLLLLVGLVFVQRFRVEA